MRAKPLLIKLYANRRLYCPEAMRYLAFSEVAELVANGERFIVKDAETGDDVTRTLIRWL